MNCFVTVTMVTADFNMVYLIFSVLNDRGLDLSMLDKLKSDILSKSNPENRKKLGQAWDLIHHELNEDMNKISLFLRIAELQKKSDEKDIGKLCEEIMTSKNINSEEFFVLIIQYCLAHKYIAQEYNSKNTDLQGPLKKIYEKIDQLKQLESTFHTLYNKKGYTGFWEWKPLVYRKLSECFSVNFNNFQFNLQEIPEDKYEDVLEYLTQIENISVFLAIIRFSSNQRLDYYIKKSYPSTTGFSDSIILLISKGKLKKKLDKLHYSKTFHQVLLYLFLRIENNWISLVEQKRINLTLEFISSSSDIREIQTDINNFGNLALVTNKSAQPFIRKRGIYSNSQFFYTKKISEKNTWTSAMINERRNKLIKKWMKVWNWETLDDAKEIVEDTRLAKRKYSVERLSFQKKRA